MEDGPKLECGIRGITYSQENNTTTIWLYPQHYGRVEIKGAINEKKFKEVFGEDAIIKHVEKNEMD